MSFLPNKWHNPTAHRHDTGAFISLLIVHSFSRVVHRREKEAWIEQAASRTIRVNPPGPYTHSHTHSVSRRAIQTSRAPSTLRKSRSTVPKEYYGVGDPNDPYSEVRPLDGESREWQFGTIQPSPPQPTREPIVLSVRNVTPDSTVTQEFEFEKAPPLQREVSWKSYPAYPRRI